MIDVTEAFGAIPGAMVPGATKVGQWSEPMGRDVREEDTTCIALFLTPIQMLLAVRVLLPVLLLPVL